MKTPRKSNRNHKVNLKLQVQYLIYDKNKMKNQIVFEKKSQHT